MHAKYMREAIRLSLEKMLHNHGGPFGAVVVASGKIIGRGWNQVATSNDPTAHAEIMAIREACRKLRSFSLEDCELYSSCEPCPMCLGAIYWARLSKVYYGNTRQNAAEIGFIDDFLYREIATKVSRRKIPMRQLLRREAIRAFLEWKKKPDRILY